jgi:hypothetical protein
VTLHPSCSPPSLDQTVVMPSRRADRDRSFDSKIAEIQQRRDGDEFEQKVRKITKEEWKEPVVDSRSQRDALIQK